MAIAGAVAIVVGGFILVLLALAGRAVYSRATFGTWDPAAPPTRISYCNRTYLPGSHVTRIQINADGNSLGTFPLRQVGATADGKPIVAKPLPDNVRHQYGNASPLPCAMVVYLKLGDDDYVAYGLSGGP